MSASDLNPSSHVTRFDSMCGTPAGIQSAFRWPTCETHYNLTFSISTWNTYAWSSSYTPHGPIHIHVGGVGGECHSWHKELGPFLSEKSIDTLKTTAFLYPRNAYRHSVRNQTTHEHLGFLLEAPEYCTPDAIQDCKVKCFGGDKGHFTEEEMELYLGQFYNNADRGYELVTREGLNISTLSHYQKQKLVRKVFCEASKYYAGDQLESSSPVEAIFWPIHPTMDRLLQYKHIASPFKDLRYSNPTGNETVYCRYHATSNCEGHHPGDMTVFRTSTLNASSGQFESSYLTNEELLRSGIPGTTGGYILSYIYGSFAWEHCNATYGLQFPSIWETAS